MGAGLDLQDVCVPLALLGCWGLGLGLLDWGISFGRTGRFELWELRAGVGCCGC